MKTIKEYEAMSVVEQESFIAHASADLVQKMYYGNDSKGLEVFMKNLTAVRDRARDCIECLGILRRENDVCAKIYLMLDYLNKRGISEEVVSGLEEIADFAQEILAQAGGAIPTEAERREIMKRLRNVLNRNDNQELPEAAMTQTNPAAVKKVSAGMVALHNNITAALSKTAETEDTKTAVAV